MNSISGSTSAAAETFNTLRDDVKKFLDPRYYRRFYLNESASIEDAVEDFISHGWEAGKNLNPVLHTQFIRTFYFDQAKSLPDFINLIKRPLFPNALCCKEVDAWALLRDIKDEAENYSVFGQYFSFDVDSYCALQRDVAQNPHFESILYHLFFVGLSQNRLRKAGFLSNLHCELGQSDYDCVLSQKEPFIFNAFYESAFLLSDIFQPSFYKKKHEVDLVDNFDLLDHFFVEGWVENLDPHPLVHLSFIKSFYRLSSDGKGFEQFIQLVQNEFIPNALIQKPCKLAELSKCFSSFDTQRQSEFIAIDVKRYTSDHYKIIRDAKMPALNHLYLFGLHENALSKNGHLSKFFLPRLAGIDDYELLSKQPQPLSFSLASIERQDVSESNSRVSCKLFIGVVLYCNSSDEITRLLSSISNNICTSFSEIKVTLYDNSPFEESFDMSKIECSNLGNLSVELMYDPGNCGFSVGHNRMMQICFEDPDSFYLGLNPDGYLLPDSLERVHEFMSQVKKPFLCEVNTEPLAHPKWYHPITGLTDWVSGVAFLIDRSAFNLLGGFDSDFPMYCEDVDLSFRAYACGVNLYVTPFFGFYHDTSDRIYHQADNAWRSSKSLVGEWYLCRKWGNLERALDLEKLMFSREFDFNLLPDAPEVFPEVHRIVYDLIRSPRYSRSLY